VIAALLAAAVALAPADVLARYAAALAETRTPAVLTFEYTLEQSGTRNGEQRHRVFRSGNDERDELLVADGRKLTPPSVRIFHNRPNRYTLERLAPRPGTYAFRFVGENHGARGAAYVFAANARVPGPFKVTSVTIDATTFLPTAIAFETTHEGRGTVSFAPFDRYWMPTDVNVRANYGNQPVTERLGFTQYRFPATLPPGTFAPARLSEAD
jgi:hypothetical protein